MLLYLIWATRPITDSEDIQPENRPYHSPEAIEACTKTLACFAERWTDALPYLKLFQFLQQRMSPLEDQLLTLEEAQACLEQLKEKHLHRAILGMIEDMMYGSLMRYESLTDDFIVGIP